MTKNSPAARKPKSVRAWAVVEPDGRMVWWDRPTKDAAETLMVVKAFGSSNSRDEQEKMRAIEAAYAIGYRCIRVLITPE
jgi:hypothetical protein